MRLHTPLVTPIVAAIAAACSPAPRGAPRVDSAAVESAAPNPAAADAFEGTLARTERPTATAEAATLTAVRAGAAHPGFERVVLELDASELPGFTVEYAAAAPTACGSGAPIPVAGGAHLVIRLDPARAHRIAPDSHASVTVTERDRRFEGARPLRQLTLVCDFEGVVEWVVGLDRRRPYRALTLAAPARLVVDVRTDAPAGVRAEVRR